MSASLVGSEMCIRDRLRHFVMHAFDTGMILVGLCQMPPVAGWRGGGPVSYTHRTLQTICSV
eukprot:11884393-Alexandrium_andersonii.AAC.1